MINEKFQVAKVECEFDSGLNFTAAIFENDSWCQIQDDTEKRAWWVDSPFVIGVVTVTREQFFRAVQGENFQCDHDDHDWKFLSYGGCNFEQQEHFSHYCCSVCGSVKMFSY